MSEPPVHDLHVFMQQLSGEMASEYQRIRSRALEDPGTAGDQGEENWATLLRNWLPPYLTVVTKGRIISESGVTSPQVDVIVLADSYPKALHDKKLFLAAGVVAAFECKITLRANHIPEALENSKTIKGLFKTREGTPYKELHSPIFFGLLAHSHDWTNQASKPIENITKNLEDNALRIFSHPRDLIDVVCVADCGTWTTMRTAYIGPKQLPSWSADLTKIYGATGSAASAFACSHADVERQQATFTPMGSMISKVIRGLAWEDARIRNLSDYFRLANLWGTGEAKCACGRAPFTRTKFVVWWKMVSFQTGSHGMSGA